MNLPMIFMTEGRKIHIRFPKPTRKHIILLGKANASISEECYEPKSAAQVAVKWAKQFPAKWFVNRRPDGNYDVMLEFDRVEDAQEFKNNFMKNVYGI